MRRAATAQRSDGHAERYQLEREFLATLWLEPSWFLEVPDFTYDYWLDDSHRRLYNIIYETIVVRKRNVKEIYRAAAAERSLWDEYCKSVYPEKERFFSIAESLKEWHKKLRLRDILERGALRLSNGEVYDVVLLDTLSDLTKFLHSEESMQLHQPEKLMETAVELARQKYGGHFIPLGINPAADNEGLVGLYRKEIVLLTGRTGKGKTTVALNITHRLLTRGYRVIYYSTEMPAIALYTRLLAIHNHIPWYELYGRNADERKVSEAATRFNKMLSESKGALTIVDHPLMDWLAIETAAQHCKALWGGEFDVAVVDYVQQIVSPQRYETRASELQALSSWLHSFARQHNVAVLLLAQVNQQEEVRECRVFAHDAALHLHLAKVDASSQLQAEAGIAPVKIELRKVRYLGALSNWHFRLHISTGVLEYLSSDAVQPVGMAGMQQYTEETDSEVAELNERYQHAFDDDSLGDEVDTGLLPY